MTTDNKQSVLTDEELTQAMYEVAGVYVEGGEYHCRRADMPRIARNILSRYAAPQASAEVTQDLQALADKVVITNATGNEALFLPAVRELLAGVRALKAAPVAEDAAKGAGDVDDRTVGVAIALEQQRAIKIAQDVRARHPFGRADIPSPAEAAFDAACEEIEHRLRTEQWSLGGVDAPLPERQQCGGSADLQSAFKDCWAKIIKSLSAIATAGGPDDVDDTELLYRSPVMDEVVRIRQACDELSRALAAHKPVEGDLTLRQQYEDACIFANANARDAERWRKIVAHRVILTGMERVTGLMPPLPGNQDAYERYVDALPDAAIAQQGKEG